MADRGSKDNCSIPELDLPLNLSPVASLTAVLICGQLNDSGSGQPRQGTTVAEWETSSLLSPSADIVMAVFLIITDLVAICFNACVIILSVRSRHSLNPSDVFVVLLAASDLGHPLLGYPMCIAAALKHHWPFGHLGCQVHGFLGFLFGVNSMMALACMSFSRLLSVALPNFARNHGKEAAGGLVVFCLVYALFWSMCPLIGWGRYDLEPYRTSCTLQWTHPDTSFVTASFIGCLALPACMMCASYGHITVLALRTGMRRRKWNLRRDEGAWSRQELRLLKMTVAMCSVFLLSWTPYAALAMAQAYSPALPVPVQLTPLAAVAAKCSHAIDPVLYCALNRRFRRFFLDALGAKDDASLGFSAETTAATAAAHAVRCAVKVKVGQGEEVVTFEDYSPDVESRNLTDSTADWDEGQAEEEEGREAAVVLPDILTD